LVSRRVLDALIKCGAFDSLGIARAALMAQAEQAIRIAQKAQSDADTNQIGLFGGAVKVPKMPVREPIAEWDAKEKLKNEKEALGFYITAHPLDKYERELARIGKLTTNDLPSAPDGSQVQIAGVIHAVKLKNNKSGKRYATFSLEDRDGAVEAIAWSETYQRFEAIIMGDEPVVARGKLDVDDERAQIIIESLVPLDSALVESVREVRIKAPLNRLDNGGLDALKQKLSQYRGRSLTYLHLGLDDGREAVMLLGDSYRVTPTESFVSEMEQILTPGAIELR
jgi:DNA polymerase-3 subunit alpha